MRCPDEVAGCLSRIVSVALVNVRGFGFTQGDARRCAIEADHVHNLPGLIVNFSMGALRYYYDVARPEYIRQLTKDKGTLLMFQPLWDELEAYLNTQTGAGVST